MKANVVLAGVVVLIASSLGSARAGNADLEIHIVPRGLDHNEKRAADASAATIKEHWVYDVTIENKTFKELTDLQVVYSAFFKQEKFGSTQGAEAKRKKGTVSIASLKPHEKKTISTESIEIAKHGLAGGWTWNSGAKQGATDSLDGLWIRVMQGGQQFAEYANPSSLLKEKWE